MDEMTLTGAPSIDEARAFGLRDFVLTEEHTCDADCEPHLVDDECTVCGVVRMDRCGCCGQYSYHADACAEGSL